MKEKCIAITKKGYDILRIIELERNEKECGFKICPLTDAKNVDIYYLKLFSDVELFPFDNNKRLEITYHRSNNEEPAKIHLKLIDNANDKIFNYITLPLDKIISPNVNTEFPIPLFQVAIPDNLSNKKYQKRKNHLQFEIEDNNVIEIFLTKKDFINSNFATKWPKTDLLLFSTSIEYYATGLTPKYVKTNIAPLSQSPKTICMSANVTNDIGIRINTIRRNKTYSKLEFLFIENIAYLAFLEGLPIKYTLNESWVKLYEDELYNNKHFNIKEKHKWENTFNEEFKKLNKLIVDSNGKYEKQFIKYKLREQFKKIFSKESK